MLTIARMNRCFWLRFPCPECGPVEQCLAQKPDVIGNTCPMCQAEIDPERIFTSTGMTNMKLPVVRSLRKHHEIYQKKQVDDAAKRAKSQIAAVHRARMVNRAKFKEKAPEPVK